MSAWTPWWARHDHPRQIGMPTTEHTGEPTPQFGPTTRALAWTTSLRPTRPCTHGPIDSL